MIIDAPQIPAALVEVLLSGQAGNRGLAATLVTLGRKGHVQIRERAGRRGPSYEFLLCPDRRPQQAEGLSVMEQLLLRCLSEMAVEGQAGLVWKRWAPRWRSAVMQCAEAEGVLSHSAFWTIFLLRQGWKVLLILGLLSVVWGVAEDSLGGLMAGIGLAGLSFAVRLVGFRWLLRGVLFARWHAVAERLRYYPRVMDALPRSRDEWDVALAYALAVGHGGGFLRRARELCEYYERSFQGVVMTFYTPHWYVYNLNRDPGIDRFAFLTEGLSRLLVRFSWEKLVPAAGVVHRSSAANA